MRFAVKDETTFMVSQGSRYVGEVSQCPASLGQHFTGLFCGGCKGWHGYTYTAAIPGSPYVNITSDSRAGAAKELERVRARWVRIIAASKF